MDNTENLSDERRRNLRRQTYNILEASTLRYKWHPVNVFLMVLIGLNVIAIALETVSSISAGRQHFFQAFDTFSVVIFSIEYIARIWSCVENPRYHNMPAAKARFKYAVTPMALIDLLAILPFYLSFFVSFDLRALRVLRLARILKFTRYADSLNLFSTVFKEEAPMFISGIGLFLIVVILAATGVYYFEHNAQPEAFSSIPEGMWWAITTVTTVGYGDVVPITVAGRVFGALVMVLGVGMLGLTSGVVASAFGDEMRARRQFYKTELKNALVDGKISDEEMEALNDLRDRLNLAEIEALHLLNQAMNEEQLGMRSSKRFSHCPYCGEKL